MPALTTIQANNKLVQYRREIIREYVRENLFSPYMGDGLTAIIRTLSDNKRGGEQVNIPLVTRLAGAGFSTGTLAGNEEAIDNYGCRMFVDWARNAVKTNKAETQKDSADLFGEAKPLLSDWGKELQRDEIIEALMALPSEAAPANLGSSAGQRVNGVLYEAATAGQRNTWNADNSDRVLYGVLKSNYSATHATALANIDAAADKYSRAINRMAKRIAKNANPRIRPFKTEDGREYFVAFTGTNPFRDMKLDLETINKDARPREGGGMNQNPIFQDGDLLDDGVIIREVPEISTYVTDVWTTLLTAGATSSRVEPVFLCGQSALAFPWGQLPRPTFLKEDDYGFLDGAGVEMCYGVGKIFKKHSTTKLVQWGIVTIFVSAAIDA